MPLYVPPPPELGIQRATGSIPPPAFNFVRTETASASGYQQLTQGIRPETEIVINYQHRGDEPFSEKGQYILHEEIVNDPSGSYTRVVLSLDNGAGVGAMILVPVSEEGFVLTDEDRALQEEQRRQAIEAQQAAYMAQAAQEYVEPVPVWEPPVYETTNYYPSTPAYDPASGYQASETAAPVSQPEVQSLPQEQAPPAGCETRTIHYFDDAENDYFFDQHDSGGGNWS